MVFNGCKTKPSFQLLKNLFLCIPPNELLINISQLSQNTIKILGFSNISSWLIGLLLLMDMSILIRGLKHVFFYQSTWIKWFLWPIHILIKLNNLNQNGQWVLVKWDIYLLHPTYNLTTYLPTYLPTYQPTHLPKYNIYYPPAQLPTYLLTYLSTHL